jgi:hypothetical protein
MIAYRILRPEVGFSRLSNIRLVEKYISRNVRLTLTLFVGRRPETGLRQHRYRTRKVNS